MDHAGCGQNGACYDLPDFEGVEIQTFIEFSGKGVGLRPSSEGTKLLLDNRSGPIFDGAAHHSAVAPKLRGKGKSAVHNVKSSE